MKTNPHLQRRFRLGISVGYGAFSVLVVVLGMSYVLWSKSADDLPSGLEFTTDLFPIQVWGIAWVLAGVLGVVAALTQLRRGIFELAITTQVIMHLMWSAFYAIGWAGDSSNGYLYTRSSVSYVILLLLIAGCVTALRPVPIVEDEA